MTYRTCDGTRLVAAFRGAVANLEAHVDEVNELNVFPVPDGDTGSNMLATVRVALDEAEAVADQPAGRVAAAISLGALMGARGNSGVIVSQICRGIAEGLEGKRRFNGLDFAHALTRGAELAYAAVGKPVEGTILTVVREAAAGARAAAEHDDDLEAVLGATVDAAERSVARTPALLPILREAGVVDSGGQGLYRLFQGALLEVLGTSPAGAVAAGGRAGAKPSALVAHADDGFGFETMLLVQPHPGASLDVDEIRRRLEAIGESVVVVGDAQAVKVHVHSERPDEVLALALALGNLSRISVENLDQQAREVRERRATEFTAARPALEPPPISAATGIAPSAAEIQPGRCPWRSLPSLPATAWRRSSATSGYRPWSGAASRPIRASRELLEAIEAANAVETLLLPNNAERDPGRPPRGRPLERGPSTSCRPATPPRESPPCWPSTRPPAARRTWPT